MIEAMWTWISKRCVLVKTLAWIGWRCRIVASRAVESLHYQPLCASKHLPPSAPELTDPAPKLSSPGREEGGVEGIAINAATARVSLLRSPKP